MHISKQSCAASKNKLLKCCWTKHPLGGATHHPSRNESLGAHRDAAGKVRYDPMLALCEPFQPQPRYLCRRLELARLARTAPGYLLKLRFGGAGTKSAHPHPVALHFLCQSFRQQAVEGLGG